MALDKDMEIKLLKEKIAGIRAEYDAKYEGKMPSNDMEKMKEGYETEIARLTKIKNKQLENLMILRRKLKMR